MGYAVTHRWESVERWSPTLFLVGGGLLVGHAAMSGVHAFTDLATPPDVFVTAGHLVAMVGLLGLYPVLAVRTPTMARGAGAAAAVGIASWFVMTVTQFSAFAGVVPSLSAVLPGAFFAVVLASTILTYLLFGAAIVRTDESTRAVGLLVLAPGALTAALVVDAALTGVSALDGLVVGGGLALSMLALGHRLRTWDRPTGRTARAGDATGG